MIATRPDKSKLYVRKMPATWWLRNKNYFLFMMRELSSVFIALFLVIFLVQLYQLSSGPQAYAAFAEKLGSPGWVLFHLVALIFAVYHSLTWFQSTAVVLPLRVGGREVPKGMVTALNIGVWIIVSLIILVLFLSFRS